MKILVTSDIHANLEALSSVLDAAKGHFDGFICLGDIIGYGPDPESCIYYLKELQKNIKPCVLLAGNHEAGLLKKLPIQWFSGNARQSLKKTAPLISWKNRFFLMRLRPVRLLQDTTVLVHGSPLEPLTEYLTGGQETVISLQYLYAEGFKLCFCGHTHEAAVYSLDRGKYEVLYPEPEQTISLNKDCCIVNPGSVGFPRISDKIPGRAAALLDKSCFPAYFLLWDTAAHSITFKATYYDARITNKKIQQRLGTSLL